MFDWLIRIDFILYILYTLSLVILISTEVNFFEKKNFDRNGLKYRKW